MNQQHHHHWGACYKSSSWITELEYAFLLSGMYIKIWEAVV